MSDFPRIFAHRGASSLAPENTIAAFSKAMEVGARWFEFDVDIIGDGSLIVIHDDTLDRTTSGSESYYQLGFSDIRRLDAGRWFSDTYRFERIPEAADALAFAHAQQMGVNLEIKPCAGGARLRERLIESLAVTLRGEKVPSRLIVSSFDHELLAAFHEACPTVALGWLIERASDENPGTESMKKPPGGTSIGGSGCVGVTVSGTLEIGRDEERAGVGSCSASCSVPVKGPWGGGTGTGSSSMTSELRT